MVPFMNWVIHLSQEQNFPVHVLSHRTPEAAQFSQGMQGIAALLRYPHVAYHHDDDVFGDGVGDDETETFMDDCYVAGAAGKPSGSNNAVSD